MIRTFALMAATAGLAAAPIAAQAVPQRASAPVGEEAESLRGRGVLIPAIIAIVLALGIILLTDGDNPSSP